MIASQLRLCSVGLIAMQHIVTLGVHAGQVLQESEWAQHSAVPDPRREERPDREGGRGHQDGGGRVLCHRDVWQHRYFTHLPGTLLCLPWVYRCSAFIS